MIIREELIDAVVAMYNRYDGSEWLDRPTHFTLKIDWYKWRVEDAGGVHIVTLGSTQAALHYVNVLNGLLRGKHVSSPEKALEIVNILFKEKYKDAGF